VKVDIPSGRLEDHVRRNLRDLILIRIAARCYPATDKVLVQGVGRLTSGKTGGVADREPVAAAVGRVHFVRQHDRTVLVEAELVLGVNQDQPTLGGELAPAGKEGEGLFR